MMQQTPSSSKNKISTLRVLALAVLLSTALHAQENPQQPPKRMAADANPVFGVATIKPSSPDHPGWMVAIKGGRNFVTANTNLNDLISYAYGLHAKQIVNGPPWFLTDKFDIEAVPDAEGLPSREQFKIMVQKLLADRFKLAFHHEKKELSVYAITVAKGGPKLTVNTSGANAQMTGYGIQPQGAVTVNNLTIEAFAGVMQRTVLDRPVVDQTGLTERFDFVLKWTPDDSQFAQVRGAGIIAPPHADDPNAPPSLYTAMQEQLGLKLEPAKAPTDVIVIDHVEKPSPN
jgi:uncharacterized protein (TIGR03435 family)